eukprot:CAMPEP_0204533988 /NCGR_PEP_ID=MMETSP0661-20131031/12612_1 /ASSEMBLY_ACC=CAM_ASM_000606 /TAXON_ID=109239 /ORGANISM="Alexandrium margalefi, Strain AMGDE01CS-322" /LENGTH=852 /DNA_ID=CAMNT_0051540413 /DNA_START=76 /DNA_END=2634 /DNA_ORIENTATION=-
MAKKILLLTAGLLAGGATALRHQHQPATDQDQAAVALSDAKLDVDSGSPVGGYLVATVGAYPGSTGTAPAGTIVVTKAAGINLKGVLTGLETGATGGIHIHSGFTCSDAAQVGGHYYDGMSTDPWTTTYTSDANGVAEIDLTLALFSPWNDYPVAGRALVIHNTAGTRVGCGLLEFTPGQVAHMGTYPEFTGSEQVKGVIVTTQTASGILMTGTLSGLPASTTAGFHIHTGNSCDKNAGVLGHYYEGMSSDPWSTTYTSDSSGVAQISLPMSGFSLYADMPVMGRTVVVHSSSAKIGCGLIGIAETLVATVGAYPGYSGAAPSGTIAVTATTSGIQMQGVVTGLPASTTGGFHIHSGFACTVDADVGGHYFEGMTSDPWSTTYTSDAQGVASITLPVASFTLSGSYPVAGRTVVLHDGSGVKIGCGLLQVSSGQVTHLGVYPGYTGSEVVKGTIVTTKTSTGILMTGTMGGLPASATAGFHIHSGYSCSAAAGVGGHYFEGMSSDPWTTTYSSDASGAASINLAMADFSLYATYPVMGRTVVVHSSSAKIACGLVGQAEALVGKFAAYPGYSGSVAPKGTFAVFDSPAGLVIEGVLTNLDLNADGGIHIHSGFSCSVAGDVGGHYDDGLSSDPWVTKYYSDGNGQSGVRLTMPGFTISSTMPVAGRALVVHDHQGTRTGCALLKVSTGQITQINLYPGYAGGHAAKGLIVTEDTASGVLMTGTLAGVPASTTAGFHIHSGYSCDAAAGVGGHYVGDLGSDPWTTTYASDYRGAAEISLAMPDFSLYSRNPVLSRTIVVHSTSAKIGCGFPGTALTSNEQPPNTNHQSWWLVAIVILGIVFGAALFASGFSTK